MTWKELCQKVFDADSASDRVDVAAVGISKSGAVKVDRQALHSSDRFRRQLDALQKIDEKLLDVKRNAS